jgi:hypothetical protein
MKYTLRIAHGDAGEFFFAYKIASVLNWPCRLFDIDIGIDAQVEIVDEDDETSTGRFVAFQVKATSAGEQTCRYVSKRQLAYWRALDLPVFVVLVDLLVEKMYLHQVLSNNNYPPATKKGFVRIEFDLANDVFTKDSGTVIAAASEKMALSHVRRHLGVVEEGIQEIREAIADAEENPDPLGLIELMEGRIALRKELAQAGALVHALRTGKKEWKTVADDLNEALDELSGYMQDWNMQRDWDDHGNIMRFIEELR